MDITNFLHFLATCMEINLAIFVSGPTPMNINIESNYLCKYIYVISSLLIGLLGHDCARNATPVLSKHPRPIDSIFENSQSRLHSGHTFRVFSHLWMQSK